MPPRPGNDMSTETATSTNMDEVPKTGGTPEATTEVPLEESKEEETGTEETKEQVLEEGVPATATEGEEKFEDETEDDDDNGKKKKTINWATVPTSVVSWLQNFWTVVVMGSCIKPIQEWCKSVEWSNHCNLRTRTGKAAAAILFVVAVSIGIVVGAFSSVEDSIAEGFEMITSMETSLNANMIKHPAYDGDLTPYGKVTLRFDEPPGSFLVVFQVEGLEQFCQGCTWRIVQASSCQDANDALLGEDLWNPELLDHNPYGSEDHSALYDTQEGISTSKLKFFAGYGPKDIADHAFLMFAEDQSPLACGVLHTHGQPSNHQLRYTAQLTRYGDALTLPGYAEMEFYLDDTLALHLYLADLPSDCINCIVDIQDGASCDQSELGNVYYNQDVYDTNVWTAHNGAVYTPNNVGAVERTIHLHDGFGFDDHEGKLVILRKSDTGVYACGVLETKLGHLEKPSMSAEAAV